LLFFFLPLAVATVSGEASAGKGAAGGGSISWSSSTTSTSASACLLCCFFFYGFLVLPSGMVHWGTAGSEVGTVAAVNSNLYLLSILGRRVTTRGQMLAEKRLDPQRHPFQDDFTPVIGKGEGVPYG
jgi:hypothetical protein